MDIFELVSESKINRLKTVIMGINLEANEEREAVILGAVT